MLIQQKVVCPPLSQFSNVPKICILTLWGIFLRTNIVRKLGTPPSPLDFDGQEGVRFSTIENVTDKQLQF